MSKLQHLWLQIPLKQLARTASARESRLNTIFDFVRDSHVVGVIFHGIEKGGLNEFDDALDKADDLDISSMVGATIGATLSLSVAEYIGGFASDVQGLVLAPDDTVDAPWEKHADLLETSLQRARLVIDQPPSLQTPRGSAIARAFARVVHQRAPADIDMVLGHRSTRIEWQRFQAELAPVGLHRPMVPTIDIHPRLDTNLLDPLRMADTTAILRARPNEFLETIKFLRTKAQW